MKWYDAAMRALFFIVLFAACGRSSDQPTIVPCP